MKKLTKNRPWIFPLIILIFAMLASLSYYLLSISITPKIKSTVLFADSFNSCSNGIEADKKWQITRPRTFSDGTVQKQWICFQTSMYKQPYNTNTTGNTDDIIISNTKLNNSFVIQSHIKVEKEKPFGLVFGYTDINNYYKAVIAYNSSLQTVEYKISQIKDGNEATITSAVFKNPDTFLDRTNSYALSLTSNQVLLSKNGLVKLTANLPFALNNGQAGIYSSTDNELYIQDYSLIEI